LEGVSLCGTRFINRSDVSAAVIRLRESGVSAVSVNTYLRCINAFLAWLHTEGHLTEPIRVPKLKEPKKVLATFTPEQIKAIIGSKPKG